MKIGKRDLKQLIRALIKKQHYVTLFYMLRAYPNFFDSWQRYLFGTGKYPHEIAIRTPWGMISPEIFSYHDMLTVNEVFCRQDYYAKNDIKTIVDIGSNIGISALYFLTRNNYSKCYLFEPVSVNIDKLYKNLERFNGRFIVRRVAVTNERGIKKFGVEETGRHGGLNRDTGNYINVDCVHVNDAIGDVLEAEKQIDILKIDIEGDEIDVVKSINREYFKKIKVIYFEIDHTVKIKPNFSIWGEYFYQKKYGDMIKLTSKL